jgi:tetratricopeptide (TPR) repeat protein
VKTIVIILVAAAFLIPSQIRADQKKTYLLSDTEVTRIKEQIRTRCHLPQANEASYPWYYHYEVGIAMKDHNDWQRALDSFLAALDHRDKPQRLSRIYGMWYMDYYPYYNIGVAHYHLQNWKCAVDSFRLSQTLEDIPAGSKDFIQLRQLEAHAEENVGDSNN